MSSYGSKADLEAVIQSSHGPNTEPDLEVSKIQEQIRQIAAPLAFLYDLRVGGGIAHPASASKAQAAAEKLGLAAKNWTRHDFSTLLEQLISSIASITTIIERAIGEDYNG
jgi:hypothetical protein